MGEPREIKIILSNVGLDKWVTEYYDAMKYDYIWTRNLVRNVPTKINFMEWSDSAFFNFIEKEHVSTEFSSLSRHGKLFSCTPSLMFIKYLLGYHKYLRSLNADIYIFQEYCDTEFGKKIPIYEFNSSYRQNYSYLRDSENLLHKSFLIGSIDQRLKIIPVCPPKYKENIYSIDEFNKYYSGDTNQMFFGNIQVSQIQDQKYFPGGNTIIVINIHDRSDSKRMYDFYETLIKDYYSYTNVIFVGDFNMKAPKNIDYVNCLYRVFKKNGYDSCEDQSCKFDEATYYTGEKRKHMEVFYKLNDYTIRANRQPYEDLKTSSHKIIGFILTPRQNILPSQPPTHPAYASSSQPQYSLSKRIEAPMQSKPSHTIYNPPSKQSRTSGENESGYSLNKQPNYKYILVKS